MPLTEKQIGNLTVRDIERIAQRFGSALETIREGQSLLGGTGLTPSPAAVRVRPPRNITPPSKSLQFTEGNEPPPLADPHRGVRPANSVNWTAEERAFRESQRLKREEEAVKAIEEADA